MKAAPLATAVKHTISAVRYPLQRILDRLEPPRERAAGLPEPRDDASITPISLMNLDLRNMDRAQLEAIASGITMPSGDPDPGSVGGAKAEILRRDREYADMVERSRRAFEREMSAAADAREDRRQKFDEELAQRQVAQALKLAREQLRPTQAASRAAIAAAIAAFLSAAVAAVTALPIIKPVWFTHTTAAQVPSSAAAPTTHQ